MQRLMAFICGVVFGLGLLLAGMVNPAKVLGFLDLAGQWDPSLGMVMLGAIGTALIPMQWSRKQKRSLLGAPMRIPALRTLDRRLVVGSLVFGVGWGIAGICPGPALALVLTGHWQITAFVLAMLAGMAVYSTLENWRGR
ncbi:MAG: YeeE/YedE family protein [Pseudomonas sp.]